MQNNTIDIAPEQLALVKEILQKYVPSDVKIWIFGSRVTGNAKKYSDLDIALQHINSKKIAQQILNDLYLAFDESLLPWKVDLVDYCDLSENFQKIIEQHRVLLNLDYI